MRPDLFCFLSPFSCKENGDIRGFSYLRPFWLNDRLFFLFLSVNCGSVFNFKESGMDEFLSVKNLLIAPLC